MAPADLANIPKNQLDALPVFQSGAGGGAGGSSGFVTVRKWTAAQTGVDESAPQTDANGHVFVSTNWLNLSGCRSFVGLIERINVSGGGGAPARATDTIANPQAGPTPWGITPTFTAHGAINEVVPNDGASVIAFSALIGDTNSIRFEFATLTASPINTYRVAMKAIRVGMITPSSGALEAVLTFDGTPVLFTFISNIQLMEDDWNAPAAMVTTDLVNAGDPTIAEFVDIVIRPTASMGGTVQVTWMQITPLGGLGVTPDMLLWFQQRIDASDAAPTSLGPTLNLPMCGMSQINTTPTVWPAAVTESSQRIVRAFDLSEIQGAAGTVGAEQADARLFLSFGLNPVDSGDRYSLTLWGTS